jgi:pilus assembly protein Flp/PilA
MKDLAMNKLTQKIRNFVRDEEGLTMVEYAVAGGLITLGAVAAFTTLGENIAAGIGAIAGKIKTG